MKKAVILVINFIIGYCATAQVNTVWPAPGTSANVGIGSPNPGAKFEIVAVGAVSDPGPFGTLQITRPATPAGNDFAIAIVKQATAVSGIGIIPGTNNLGLWASTGSAGVVPQLSLGINGNIGMGISSPVANLHINGLNANTIRLSSTNDPAYYTTILNDYNFAEAFSIRHNGYNIIRSKAASYQVVVGDAGITQEVSLATIASGKTTIPYGKLHIGNVAGINSSGYLLAVNGDIVAKKIKITQTGWADYVFDPAYNLPTLAHVEEFIKLNHRLPGVPSANEVEKEGIEIGKSQAMLLQKIEELTLYVLQQQKSILEFQNRLSGQAAEIKNLKEGTVTGNIPTK